MKRMVLALCFGAGAAMVSVSTAHRVVEGKHDGLVRYVDGFEVEIVAGPEGAIFYVEADGKPVSTRDMSGKVVLANGMEKSEAELKPVGENKLLARGLRLQPGSQGLASLRTSRKVITVQFTMR